MVPAMDRASKTTARWIRLGLALAVASGDLGCARLRPGRRAGTPAELGSPRAGGDAYADAHRARSAGAGLQPTSAGIAGGTGPAIAAEGSEEAPTDRPAPLPEESGIALGAPLPAAGRTSPTAATGVPNASLLLASAERRSAPGPEGADLARIVAEARAALDAMTNYQVVMRRQESVNGTLQAEEDVTLAVRRDPLAVRLSWVVGPHRGREVLYRADEPGGLMHVNMADSALPIPRLSIPPDSPMVMRNSRHPITEAGFDSIVRGLEEALRMPGNLGLSHAGLETPSPLDRPHHALIRTAATGEVFRVHVDTATRLPALLTVHSAAGELLESYHFRDVRANLPELDAAGAFDPVARWGPPRGLFNRLARGNPAGPVAPAAPPPR